MARFFIETYTRRPRHPRRSQSAPERSRAPEHSRARLPRRGPPALRRLSRVRRRPRLRFPRRPAQSSWGCDSVRGHHHSMRLCFWIGRSIAKPLTVCCTQRRQQMCWNVHQWLTAPPLSCVINIPTSAQVSYNLTGTGLLPFSSSQQSGFGSALVQTLGSGYSGVKSKYLGSVVRALSGEKHRLTAVESWRACSQLLTCATASRHWHQATSQPQRTAHHLERLVILLHDATRGVGC